MQTFKLFIFVTLAGLGVLGHAGDIQDIPRLPMETCDLGPYKSLRDYWDQTKTFCFVHGHRQFRYPIADMGEIKLRENNQTMFGEYYDALTPENREIVDQYRTYYVRYLALDGAPGDQVRSFVTQVFFNWGGSTETLYVFGELAGTGEVRLTAFSSSQAVETAYRTAVQTVKSLFSILHGRNPLRVGRDEADRSDRRRIGPAADVVKKFSETLSAQTEPSVTKP